MDHGYDFPKSTFYKAMITGFFVGFCATVLCLAYNIIFRDTTKFPLSSIINVSSLIFSINILFPIIGMIYYGFITVFKKADAAFVLVFLSLTIFFVWRTEVVHRTDDQVLNIEFRNLLLGIVLILGIGAVIFIPLLYNNKKFSETVL